MCDVIRSSNLTTIVPDHLAESATAASQQLSPCRWHVHPLAQYRFLHVVCLRLHTLFLECLGADTAHVPQGDKDPRSMATFRHDI